MRSRLFAVGSAVSLLLLVTIAALWARSYWVEEDFERVTFSHLSKDAAEWTAYQLQLNRGIISFERDHVNRDGDSFSTPFERLGAAGGQPEPGFVHYSWAAERQVHTQSRSFSYSLYPDRLLCVTFPIWPIVAVTALPTCALAFTVVIRGIVKRYGAGRDCACPNCSYILTGNTSGICPECGTPVAGKAGVKR